MDLRKLAKVLALAASDNDAEALHALRTARRLLEAAGLDFVALAGRMGADPAADEALIEQLEDTIFDLRAENRQLRADNERLKSAPGLPHAAAIEAEAIRLRARLAEVAAELETGRAESLRHQAHAAQLARQLDELRAAPPRRAAAPPPPPRRPAGRARAGKGQYALF
jgi:hypothetical protein